MDNIIIGAQSASTHASCLDVGSLVAGPGGPGSPGADGWPEGSHNPPLAGGVASCVSTLDTIAKFASDSSSDDRVIQRFALQAGARSLLPDERVSSCLRRPIPGVAGVSVLYSREHNCAHLGGLLVCGLVWLCSVCGAKISERRRLELSVGVAAWSGSLSLVTLTLQHKKTDALSALLPVLLGSSRALRSGAGWQAIRARCGFVGAVTALEVTDGANGYHPHLHLLCFHDRPSRGSGDVLGRFEQDIRDRWMACLPRLGGFASRVAIDVRSASGEVASYIAKFGRDPKWTVAHELAKASSKNARGSGRSLLELLRDYVLFGDTEAGERWRGAVLALKGCNQLRFSPGLRGLLGLKKEKTDVELAEEQDDTAELLALLSLHEWRLVVANDARGELLTVARSGDAAAVASFLALLTGG